MLSSRRSHWLLFWFCGFIALLLMGSSAGFNTRAGTLVYAKAATQPAFAFAAAANDYPTRSSQAPQPTAPDDTSDDNAVTADDGDLGDEWILPSLMRVCLDRSRSAAPSNANDVLPLTPVTGLLRPPRIA